VALQGADCKDAKLQNANFTHAQVIDVDFTNTNITGICIADWSVNDQTKLISQSESEGNF